MYLGLDVETGRLTEREIAEKLSTPTRKIQHQVVHAKKQLALHILRNPDILYQLDGLKDVPERIQNLMARYPKSKRSLERDYKINFYDINKLARLSYQELLELHIATLIKLAEATKKSLTWMITAAGEENIEDFTFEQTTLKERLIHLRTRHDFSHSHLNELTGIAVTRLKSYEEGREYPGIVNLVKLAWVYKVTVGYIARGETAEERIIQITKPSVKDLELSADELLKRAAELLLTARREEKEFTGWYFIEEAKRFIIQAIETTTDASEAARLEKYLAQIKTYVIDVITTYNATVEGLERTRRHAMRQLSVTMPYSTEDDENQNQKAPAPPAKHRVFVQNKIKISSRKRASKSKTSTRKSNKSDTLREMISVLIGGEIILALLASWLAKIGFLSILPFVLPVLLALLSFGFAVTLKPSKPRQSKSFYDAIGDHIRNMTLEEKAKHLFRSILFTDHFEETIYRLSRTVDLTEAEIRTIGMTYVDYFTIVDDSISINWDLLRKRQERPNKQDHSFRYAARKVAELTRDSALPIKIVWADELNPQMISDGRYGRWTILLQGVLMIDETHMRGENKFVKVQALKQIQKGFSSDDWFNGLTALELLRILSKRYPLHREGLEAIIARMEVVKADVVRARKKTSVKLHEVVSVFIGMKMFLMLLTSLDINHTDGINGLMVFLIATLEHFLGLPAWILPILFGVLSLGLLNIRVKKLEIRDYTINQNRADQIWQNLIEQAPILEHFSKPQRANIAREMALRTIEGIENSKKVVRATDNSARGQIREIHRNYAVWFAQDSVVIGVTDPEGERLVFDFEDLPLTEHKPAFDPGHVYQCHPHRVVWQHLNLHDMALRRVMVLGTVYDKYEIVKRHFEARGFDIPIEIYDPHSIGPGYYHSAPLIALRSILINQALMSFWERTHRHSLEYELLESLEKRGIVVGPTNHLEFE